MRVWRLTHGQDGWQIHVISVPAWAYAVEEGWLWLMSTPLLDPCCRRPGRWLFVRLPGPIRDWLALAHMVMLNLGVAHPADRREVVVFATPVNVDVARRIDPEFAAEMEEIFGGDSEPLGPAV